MPSHHRKSKHVCNKHKQKSKVVTSPQEPAVPAQAASSKMNGLSLPSPCPVFPCPQCVDYDPNNPPPGWPIQVVPWAGRENIPSELRCNLTPPLVNISSRDAFEGYQSQSLGGGKKVVIFDVRTPEEVVWVGVPTQVNSLTLMSGEVVVPDNYLVTLRNGLQSDHLEYLVGGVLVKTSVLDVASTNLTGISYNVPVEFVDCNTGVKTLNPLFGKMVDGILRETGADRAIFFCRSGQRSSIGCYYQYCPFEILFPGVLSGSIIAYEVEGDVNGYGGFEGNSNSDRFIGYRGFPGRRTAGVGAIPSVSFKDMNLPIKIGTLPKIIKVDPMTGATLYLDSLDAAPWANRIMSKRRLR